MKVKAILQARLSSSRLPAKMLLPILGLPLVVLCAKRLISEHFDLVVATSNDPSDDLLVEELKKHNIPYHRGSLTNVLSRFIELTNSLNEQDIVLRLTGDNPVVDRQFCEKILAHHQNHDGDYTRSCSPIDRLPYGLSAEVLSVKALRNIASQKNSDLDLEHITYSKTQAGDYHLYSNTSKQDLSHLRVTVDTFDDYVQISKAFNSIQNWNAPYQDILAALQNVQTTPKFRIPYQLQNLKPVGKLAIGGAQFGMNYGIANQVGQNSLSDVSQILKLAIKHGVTLIDTAQAYGNSEAIIGQALSAAEKQDITITTKLSPFPNLHTSATKEHVQCTVRNSVLNSLHQLQLQSLPVLMLHRWSHYSAYDGEIIRTLKQLQREGYIQKIGASAQTPTEAKEALNAPDIEFIQLPFNILDSRWQQEGIIDLARQNKNAHIQVRSCFLQGLLTLPTQQWPKDLKDHKQQAHDYLQKVKDLTNISDDVKLCLSYVKSLDWVDSIVIGVDDLIQMQNNLELFMAPELNQDTINAIDTCRPVFSEKLLNPAKWNENND